ncbi:hypothetical protein AAAU51_13220, partial [Anaerostipes amylophilus]
INLKSIRKADKSKLSCAILIKIYREVWVFKNYMDNKMINTWTQVKSYHGHFERSQTVGIIFDYNEEICIERTEKYQ